MILLLFFKYRNKLGEQQTARLVQQREVLSKRQEEMASIDRRISELQARLHRKRLLNQQLANQIQANKPGQNNRRVIISGEIMLLRGAFCIRETCNSISVAVRL